MSPDFPLAPGALHEIYAANHADGAGLVGMGMALSGSTPSRPMLWVRHQAQDREMGAPYPPGLAEWGFDPARIILVTVRDVTAALQAGLEGARCTGLGVTIIEFRGEAKAYDLTASRRLALAAKISGASVMVCRVGAEPTPSASETRWRMRTTPSQALAAQAPGHPAFEMTLLRARNGREGQPYLVEWNRDVRQLLARSLTPAADPAGTSVFQGDAALSGAVVALPSDRTRAPEIRRAG